MTDVGARFDTGAGQTYLDGRYTKLLSGTAGAAQLLTALAAAGIELPVVGSGGTTPNRPNYAGPVLWKTVTPPAIRTDGITTGGTPQAVDGLDDWVQQTS